MDFVLLISGLLQILLSLIIGVVFIYSVFKIFSKLTGSIKDSQELKNNNIAVALLDGSIIFSVIIMVKGSLESAVIVLGNTMRNPDATAGSYTEVAGIILGHIVLSGVFAFFSVYFALRFFMWLTKELDELQEIKNNNIAVGIVIGVVIIAMALLLQTGVSTLLDSLIPFPQISITDIGTL